MLVATVFREELRIGRVRTRIAALDVVEAEGVQGLGNQEFVLNGKVDAVGLGAVAEGRVEKIEAFAGHERFVGSVEKPSRASVRSEART